MTAQDPRPRHERTPRRMLWLWLAGLTLLLLVAVLLIWHFRAKKPVPVPPGIPVATELAKKGNLDVTLDALGTVTPVYTVTVTSRVAGELTEVHYLEGQEVHKNDLLAIIDPRPYQAAVLQAQGQLARDQAILKNARVDLSRYEDAYRQHAIPQQQLATQQATLDEAEGVVKIDQGNLDAANVNLAYTRIVSPIDGRVGLRLIDPGNIVAANGTTGLVTITEIKPITVIFNVAEDDLGAFAAQASSGAHMEVEALDRTQEKVLATGSLITLDNQINPATGTLRGRALFNNSHGELFPSQFVNARIHVKTLTGATLVPTASVQRNGDQVLVYIVQQGKALSRPIKVTTTEGDTTAATGVNPGDTVVTDGFDKLQDGSAVTVLQPAPAGGPAPPGQK